MSDTTGDTHTSMAVSKTRVAPLKRQTIPRLKLCGALVLAQLLAHCKTVLDVPMDQVFAWTDSTIVLSWLRDNPRRFKVYVGNRVSQIMDLLPPDRWNHVISADNPADCASRGLFPSEIVTHHLWWNGPKWLTCGQSEWPTKPVIEPNSSADEINEPCSFVCTATEEKEPFLPVDRFFTFSRLTRVTAWVLRFLRNCRARRLRTQRDSSPLSVEELQQASTYWVKLIQVASWSKEIECMKRGPKIPRTSSLLSLHPVMDDQGILRVGGRQRNATFSYNSRHPVILSSNHPLVKLLIRSEHVCLLHGGPLLVAASLSRRFHLVGGHKAIRFITRSCVVCRRRSARPKLQIMGQLPIERITPDAVFSRVRLDYAGPVYIKHGSPRRSTVFKAYICVFVSLSIKAVHLEAVSDLTADAFLACLRRFIARRGKPSRATMAAILLVSSV